MDQLFPRFADLIHTTDLSPIISADQIPDDFLLAQDGSLSAYYIPFEYVNRKAKVVLVGITPGFTQWKNAMHEAQRQLRAGKSLEEALMAAKTTGAFSGAMRPNLINLLDAIGLHQWLNIESCVGLFGTHESLVQTTSILSHPIFVGGANYNGTPGMIKTPFLRIQLLDYFVREASQLDNPVYIPLGPKVCEGLSWLSQEGVIKKERILNGLPHPSGANAERISYFLGRKEKQALSPKTNADQLDAARTSLIQQVECLA